MTERMRVFHGDPDRLALPDPALSPELLEFVEARYGLRVEEPRDLGGSFNLNLLADRHVIRVYGPWVTAARLRELQRVRRLLRGTPRSGCWPGCGPSVGCTR
jgi:hypothetical protein